MIESGSKIEQKNFIKVVGDVNLIRKKLTARPGFSVAFLLCKKDFKVYVSSDNSHEKAAKAAGLPSNNSKDILLKGRISPKISAFIFNKEGASPRDFLKGDIDLKLIDDLVPGVALALKDWLGEQFKNYRISYKGHNLDRPTGSIA